jgi:hypothetical protein
MRTTVADARVMAVDGALAARIAAQSAFMQRDLAIVERELFSKIAAAGSVSQLPCADLRDFLAVCAVKGESGAGPKKEMATCVLNLLEKEEQAGIRSNEAFQEVIALL